MSSTWTADATYIRPPAIEMTELTRYYGSTCGIEGLTLSIPQGNVFGFLGPNGAGKTTTIRLLLGLIRPSRGKACLLGTDMTRLNHGIRRHVGYLPGDLGLYQDLTGREYLRHLLRLRAEAGIGQEKLNALIQFFQSEIHQPIWTYSKGMRQMVGIIQAFAHNPRLAILDEPTTGLDPLKRERFYELVSREKRDGTTILLSSHDLNEVQRICDQVAMIREGRLIGVHDVRELRTRIGKRVRIVPAEALQDLVAALTGIPGIHGMTTQAASVTFHFTGSLRALCQRIADVPIADLDCCDPTVEEFFLGLYPKSEDHEI